MAVQILRKKFTVGQYHQMIESGILTECDRVELLQGEIIEMSPIGRQHAACVDRLTELFVRELGFRAIVRVQNPIQLSNSSESQPDFAILQRRSDFYADGHPQSQDVFALVEVSDTTIEFDRTVKVPLYAKDNIAEVWIVDLNSETVQVYREPSASGYQQLQTFRRGQSVSFQAFTDIQFTVRRQVPVFLWHCSYSFSYSSRNSKNQPELNQRWMPCSSRSASSGRLNSKRWSISGWKRNIKASKMA